MGAVNKHAFFLIMKKLSEYIKKNKAWLKTLEADLKELEHFANLKQKCWNSIYKFQPDIDACGGCMFIDMGDIWLYNSRIELTQIEDGYTDSIHFETDAPDADFPFGWIRHAIAELKKREE